MVTGKLGQRLVKISKFLVGVIAVLLGLLAILGGGFGAKDWPEDGILYQSELMLLAHRGVAKEAPENSRASFLAARDQGFKAVEIDVKESKDGHFYLFHDRSSQRLLNVDIVLADQTLGQLQQYPLHLNGIATDQYILPLDSFAKEFASDFIIYLDIKRHGNDRYRHLSEKIVEFIEKYSLGDRVFVGSDFLFTAYLEYNHPELHTVFTGPGDGKAKVYLWVPKKFRPDFMISYVDEVTEPHIQWLKRKGLMNRRMVYGVNHENQDQVRAWGIPKVMVDEGPSE